MLICSVFVEEESNTNKIYGGYLYAYFNGFLFFFFHLIADDTK